MDLFGKHQGDEAADRSGLIVDFLLNEGTADERSDVRDQLDLDPELAIECAELGDLFETLRGLDPEPGAPDRMRLAVRYAINRRDQLRSKRGPFLGGASLGDVFWGGLRTSFVAAAALVLMVGGGWLYSKVVGSAEQGSGRDLASAQAQPAGPQPGSPEVETTPVPEVGAEDSALQTLLANTDAVIDEAGDSLERAFRAQQRSFEERMRRDASGFESRLAALSAEGQTLARQIQADNMLSRLREEVSLRENDKVRRRASRAVGGPDLETRIQYLAATVAGQIDLELSAGTASVAAKSGALRALLAAGSIDARGVHSAVVDRCARSLQDQVSTLVGGELAVALAGLGEYAVVHGGEAAELVGREADRLARATIGSQVPARPALMHWRTPVAQLAEAGRVFRIAPAFGTHPDLAQKAREFVAAHLAERLTQGAERPSLAAAQLYGFGDIVDRDAAEHRLLLWRASLLIPDYQALHHLAWSKFPVRPGWAQFQTELRGLGAEPTPAATTDAASLLLCLSMNFAAPGALDVVLLSRL